MDIELLIPFLSKSQKINQDLSIPEHQVEELSELRTEIEQLRNQVKELSSLRVENEQLRKK